MTHELGSIHVPVITWAKDHSWWVDTELNLVVCANKGNAKPHRLGIFVDVDALPETKSKKSGSRVWLNMGVRVESGKRMWIKLALDCTAQGAKGVNIKFSGLTNLADNVSSLLCTGTCMIVLRVFFSVFPTPPNPPPSLSAKKNGKKKIKTKQGF